MFCPFTKEKCNSECVFYNNLGYDEEDPSSCNLYKVSEAIISFGFNQRTMENYLESIEKNTGKDNTESFSINSKLETIEEIIGKINDKL